MEAYGSVSLEAVNLGRPVVLARTEREMGRGAESHGS